MRYLLCTALGTAIMLCLAGNTAAQETNLQAGAGVASGFQEQAQQLQAGAQSGLDAAVQPNPGANPITPPPIDSVPRQPAEAQSGLNAEADLEGRTGSRAQAESPDVRANSDASASARAETRGAAPREQWRYKLHNGEWWYWMPSNYWMYHRDGRWVQYDPNSFVPSRGGRRYVTGYRGELGDNYYYDGFGRRYFDDGRGYIDGGSYFDPYGRRFYYNGGRRFYNDNQGYYYWDGSRRVYDRAIFDGRYQDPGFRRGANLGGAIGEAVGGDVGGAIGAEIGGAIGD
jgi:hypothetical protein